MKLLMSSARVFMFYDKSLFYCRKCIYIIMLYEVTVNVHCQLNIIVYVKSESVYYNYVNDVAAALIINSSEIDQK